METPTPNDLKNLRAAEGITQAAFAKLAGIKSPVHICNFEFGRSNVPELVRQKIAKEYARCTKIQNDRKRRKTWGKLFEAIDQCAAKDRLLNEMKDRIVELYNDNEFEKGDILLDFLPMQDAQTLLDCYFCENDESAD